MNATVEKRKPLGGKSYGHIPHFPGSRVTPKDHKCTDGQLRIACPEVFRETHDGNEFGLSLVDDPLQAVPDFLFKLEFEHGWAVVRESYAYHKLYCPKCRAMHNAETIQRCTQSAA